MRRRLRFAASVGIVLLVVSGASAAPAMPPLVEAAAADDVARVRALLAEGSDVDARAVDGSTALHWASHRDSADAVRLLLEAGADANAKNRYGVAPLSLAAVNGSAEVVALLLGAGAQATTAQPGGETALMTAARSGNPAVVRQLIAAGADVNATEDTKGQTALMWAAAANNTEVLRVLVDAGADIQGRSRPTGALSPAEPGDKGFTAFLFAARAGHIAAADTLLELGADVNDTLSDGTSALVLSLISAKLDMTSFLLDRGADPNAQGQGWTALHQMAWTRRPNQGLNTVGPPLRGEIDTLALVDKLVAKGANVNARMTKEAHTLYAGRNSLNRIGGTPFFLAAHRVDVELMRALLKHGADPMLANEDGTSPLMVAAGIGLWSPGENPGTVAEAAEAVKICLELGNDPNAVDANGDSALHGAAFRGSNGAVEALVAAGARLDAKNDVTPKRRSSGAQGTTGWIPLMVAEGIYINATFKSNADTAALIRRLMKERGLSTAYSLPGQAKGTSDSPPPPRQ